MASEPIAAAPTSQYKPRHELRLVRRATLQEFTCSRCGGQKKSTLVAHRVAELENPSATAATAHCYQNPIPNDRKPLHDDP